MHRESEWEGVREQREIERRVTPHIPSTPNPYILSLKAMFAVEGCRLRGRRLHTGH